MARGKGGQLLRRVLPVALPVLCDGARTHSFLGARDTGGRIGGVVLVVINEALVVPRRRDSPVGRTFVEYHEIVLAAVMAIRSDQIARGAPRRNAEPIDL